VLLLFGMAYHHLLWKRYVIDAVIAGNSLSAISCWQFLVCQTGVWGIRCTVCAFDFLNCYAPDAFVNVRMLQSCFERALCPVTLLWSFWWDYRPFSGLDRKIPLLINSPLIGVFVFGVSISAPLLTLPALLCLQMLLLLYLICIMVLHLICIRQTVYFSTDAADHVYCRASSD